MNVHVNINVNVNVNENVNVDGNVYPNRRQSGQKTTKLPPKRGICIGKVGSLGRFC